jgi:uncharacterized membrane protein
MKLSTLDRLAIALFAAQLAAAIGVGLNGPTHLIPSHFDFQGQVDGWTDRTGLAVAIAGMAVIGLLISLGLGLAVARAGDPGRRRGLTAAQAVATFLFPACAALLLFMGLGAPAGISDHSSQLMIGISLLMLGAGAVMGRVGPNPFVGVRTPWAYKSRLAWDRSNRLIGRLWLLGGLIGLAASPFAPQPTGFQALLVWMIGTALLAAVESWRVWRTDPDRQPF